MSSRRTIMGSLSSAEVPGLGPGPARNAYLDGVIDADLALTLHGYELRYALLSIDRCDDLEHINIEANSSIAQGINHHEATATTSMTTQNTDLDLPDGAVNVSNGSHAPDTSDATSLISFDHLHDPVHGRFEDHTTDLVKEILVRLYTLCQDIKLAPYLGPIHDMDLRFQYILKLLHLIQDCFPNDVDVDTKNALAEVYDLVPRHRWDAVEEKVLKIWRDQYKNPEFDDNAGLLEMASREYEAGEYGD